MMHTITGTIIKRQPNRNSTDNKNKVKIIVLKPKLTRVKIANCG